MVPSYGTFHSAARLRPDKGSRYPSCISLKPVDTPIRQPNDMPPTHADLFRAIGVFRRFQEPKNRVAFKNRVDN